MSIIRGLSAGNWLGLVGAAVCAIAAGTLLATQPAAQGLRLPATVAIAGGLISLVAQLTHRVRTAYWASFVGTIPFAIIGGIAWRDATDPPRSADGTVVLPSFDPAALPTVIALIVIGTLGGALACWATSPSRGRRTVASRS